MRIGLQYPHLAWLALAALPVILVYFLKLKRPRAQVSSLLLWRQMLQDQRVNSPFQKFRNQLPLWLQLLALLLLVLAAVQPFLRGSGAPARAREVWIVDLSASMGAAASPGGKTRLDLVKEEMRQRIKGLKADEERAILAFDTQAREARGFTGNPALLRAAVDGLAVADLPADPLPALRMAEALARRGAFERVVLFTDGNLPARVPFDLPFALDLHRVGEPLPNAGITALAARRQGSGGWEVLGRVEHNFSGTTPVRLRWHEEGGPGREDVLSLAPGESAQSLFVPASTGGLVRLDIEALGSDALAADNQAGVFLPPVRPLRVRVDSNQTLFVRAISALGGAEAAEPPDLAILGGHGAAPAGALVLRVNALPPALTNLLEEIRESGEIVDWQRDHALLRHVELREQLYYGGMGYRAGRGEADLEEAGFRVLVHGSRGPLLLEEARGGQTEWHWLLPLERSTLPRRLAFPVFVANLLGTAGERAGLSRVQALPNGALPEIRLAPLAAWTLRGPDESRQSGRARPDGRVEGLSALRSGEWRLETGGKIRPLFTSLLDARETLLGTVDQLSFNELNIPTQNTEQTREDKPFWRWLAWIMLGLLLVEWRITHRPKRGVVMGCNIYKKPAATHVSHR